MSAPLSDWLAAAVDPPRAFGAPPAQGLLRQQPEDFVVDEDLGFAPDGDGPHWLLRVRKRAANTEHVARQLASHAGVPAQEVGFAGLKDRHALTSQWFSAPRGRRTAQEWLAVRTEEFTVLEAHAHGRKLKRGALAGNAFRIRVRDVRGPALAVGNRIVHIAAHGVPNYFGGQRFGRDGNNLQVALEWAQQRRRPQGRAQGGFALSAARSLIFNALLAHRVRAGDWNQIGAGDVANLDGSGSVFAVAGSDATLSARAEALDLHPTGPMWGAGVSMATGTVAELEAAIAAAHAPLPALLEHAGLEAERRSLRLRIADLEGDIDGADLLLAFRLPAGAFATTVLRELIEGAAHD